MEEKTMQSPYSFLLRTSKKYGKIYYVRFRDPETGERMTAVSSGKTTKKAADKWAIAQLSSGNVTRKSKHNFSQYTKNWFVWDECAYIKLMLGKGKRFSRSYADNRRGFLLNHLVPYFGKMKLTEISVQSIEEFITSLQDLEYSSSTINSAFSTLSSIMKEAYRQGVIQENPVEKVQSVVKRTEKKDIVPLPIARQLFQEENMAAYWDNSLFHYLFNLIAFTTGLRQAEILALRRMDIKDEIINVEHTWDRKYGLKRPKYESERFVTVPDYTLHHIQRYLVSMSDKSPEALLFCGTNENKAIDHKTINKAYFNALGKTDLDLETLNISFHSWRHTFNTLMRGNIPEDKLRKITGHKSEKMSDHYTHYDKNSFEDVREQQNKLFLAM